MSEKLIVKNFGPINHVEIEVKKVTVFIGSQGSGKSTLAKSIGLFSSESNLKTPHFFNIESFFNKKSSISFGNVSYGKGYRMKRLNKVRSLEDIIYIPAERMLISLISNSLFSFLNNNIGLPPFLIDFGSQFEKARKKIANLNIDYLYIEYKYQNDQDRVYFNSKESLALSESASGFQSLIPLQLVVKNTANEPQATTFIIEEPELNLYPTTQKHLIHFLSEHCASEKNRLVITTHSPYILSAFNLLLFAYQVAEKYPEKAAEVAAIIPKESWINPNNFNAYYVGNQNNGEEIRPIFDPETGLISENELEEVADIIGDEFDKLMDIYSGISIEK